MRLFVVALLIAALTGCATATIGTPFPSSNVSLLRVGLSTTEEARSLLGEPQQVSTNELGEQWYLWQYIRSDATAGFASTNVRTQHQQAMLVFDQGGRLLRAQQLINVPSPITPQAQPLAPAVQTKAQQLKELHSTPGMSYEEYKRRYELIMGQQPDHEDKEATGR